MNIKRKLRTWGKRCPFYAVLFGMCFLGGHTAAWMQESQTASADVAPTAMLAIIMDDFGYHGAGTEEILALDIPFTAAVMPFSDHTAEDAALAMAAGKEIIIHMPMESLTGSQEWVGDKAVRNDMKPEEIRACVEAAYEAVPQAVGMNNHMGSAVMENAQALGNVLDVVHEKGGIFVDSVTTAQSKGAVVAGEKGVPLLERDVFLDSTEDVEVIRQRLREAADIALQRGSAVAIGHVGPEGGEKTAQVIAEMADALEQEGIRFVTVTELVQYRGMK